MSHQWSDFPSGQAGIYGTDTSNMLDGTPWVALEGAPLVADPDTVAFPNGIVLRHRSGSSGPTQAARLSLLTPHQKVGVAHRFYLASLPTSTRAFLSLNTTGNVGRYGLRVRPNGGLELSKGTTGSVSVLATADYPILFANSWNHIEIVADVVTGEIEVRKNGVEIAALTTTDGSPAGSTIGMVAFPSGNSGDGSFQDMYTKDLVVYNGAGTQFNDFQGQVSVYDQYPDGDQTLNWTPSTGSTGYNLIDETTPNDADYIEADDTPPAASEFTLSNLPADVTSVRCLTSIVRALKTDGGDGNLQVSLTPNGTNYDAGTDNPITTSATYWYDSSELSPATAAAWTPSEANAARIKIDRTT